MINLEWLTWHNLLLERKKIGITECTNDAYMLFIMYKFALFVYVNKYVYIFMYNLISNEYII